MMIGVLDSEMMGYWSMLNEDEKRSLLVTVRDLAEAKQEDNFAIELRKAVLLEERKTYLKGEELTYSWETVKKMAQGKPRPSIHQNMFRRF